MEFKYYTEIYVYAETFLYQQRQAVNIKRK